MKKHLLCSFIVAVGLVFSMPVMAGWDDGTDTGSDTGSSTQSGDHRSDVLSDFPYAYYFDILDSTAMTVSIESVYLPQTTSVSGLTIPGELTENGLTYYVRSIRNLSFSGQAMIEDVIIEEGTETIHQDAFRYLTKLRYLQLPHTITEIGEGAFNRCDSLENIYWDVPDYRATTNAYGPFYGAREHITMMNFGENVRAIPAYFCYGMTQLQGFESGSDSIRTVRHNAFEGCQSIYWFPFNDGLDTIEAQAFMGCSGLSQGLTLPTSLRFVGDSAFANCTGLMSVDFNGTPNIYGRSVFGGCTELATVTIPSTWSTIPDFLCENMSSLKNFSQLMDYSGETGAQTPISSIGQYAFSGCTNLETFTIPESVSTIGYRAFRSCVSLPTLTIPSAVTLIGSEAFDGCTGLKSIRSEAVTPPMAYTSFTGVPKTIPVIVPTGTETAYRRADGWSEFSLIMSDDTPNGTCGDALTWLFSQADSTLYIMGSGAMYDYSATATVGSMSPWMESDIASGIYYLEMDSTVTSIGENAFNGCPNLRTMKLSSALTSIGSMAFNACPLTRVELPASLTTIGAGAFGGCSMIEEVYTYAATPPTISNATGATAVPFPDMPGTVPVYVPAQSYYTYKYRTGWSNLNIKYMSLSGTCGDNLQWVLNPNDSTFVITGTGSMIDYADDQERPWVLYDENNMPTDYSMYVKTLSMPEGMTTIGKNAFYFFNITQLTIPGTVTTISDNAFGACSRLTEVTIPDNVTSIGSNTFSGCKLLNSVVIGSGVSSIGSSAFGNCVSLMTMTVSEQNRTFDSRDNCNAVINTSTNELVSGCNGTVIPNTVTSIASFAMSYCKSLTTITIPESVTLINGYAFNQCVALQSITSESVTPPTLKSGVFSGVPDTIPLYVPARGYKAYKADANWNAKFSKIIALPCDTTFRLEETVTIAETQLPYEWRDYELTATGDAYDTLSTEDGCDSILMLHLTVLPVERVTVHDTACYIELPYEWRGHRLVVSGTYHDTVRNSLEQDSIIYTNYFVAYLPVEESFESEMICDGGFYEWHGKILNEAGQYTDTLLSADGCDSICHFELSVSPEYHFRENAVACDGELFEWHGRSLERAGVYYDSLVSAYACDSIYELTLVVNPTYNMTEEATICQGEKYEWHGQSLTEAGRFTDTLHTVNGCDSICNLVLTINPAFSYSEEVIIAETQLPYVWHDREVTASGDVQDTLKTINGCDSIITLNLTVLPVERISVSDSACYVYLPVEWRGQQLVVSGTYYDTVRTTGTRLDSIIYTNHFTAYLPVESPTEEATICQGDTYTWHNVAYTEAGQYVDTLLNNDGCDSICYLQLHVNPSYLFQENAVTCEGESFEWHSRSLAVAGIYYDSLQTIHGCDSIWTLTLTVNPAYNMTEEATICQGEKYEWHGMSLTEAGRFTDTLHTVEGCDSICNLVLTVNPTFEQVAEATICEGTTYSWHGKTYTTAGIYYDSLQTIHGCDSIWTLTLTVNPAFNMTEEATICQGEKYEWHGQSLTEAGRYIDTLHTANGCDSICNLVLTVNPTFEQAAEAEICEGTTYSWHGKTYTTAGIYYDSLQTIHGCDSIWTLTLTVNPAYNMTEEATICQGEKYEWHGMSLTEAGRFTDTLHTINGCDSICNLVLTVNPTFDQTAEATICEGTTYSWHGKTYTTAGIYYDSLQTINGCDSIWTLTLTVNPAYNMTEEATICQGEKYEWHGQSLTEAGRYTDTLHTVEGCDSICNLVLTVNPTFDQTAEATICEGTTYSWHGKTYTTAGIYYDSLQTINGCDSIWTLTLTVNPSYTMTEEATICQGETYTWHDAAYTEAGRYIDTLHTVNGCDSICNLVLTVNPTFDQTAEATICEGTTYSWHGKTYTTAGIYYDSLQTIHGCDSIWTLTLTINRAYNVTEATTICQGEKYEWHGMSLTAAGRFTDTLHTVEGCDSICNLVLTVNPTFEQTAEATICEGTTYNWHGKTYTTAGIYYDSLQTIHGCDSIWTLTLTVNPAFNMTEEATICQGEKYEWHGQSLTEAGRFTDTLHTVEGCDSICNLVLTVNPTFDQAAEATICEGTTYSWHGKTYTTAGIYYDSLQTIHGCDSIWTLTLTVNPAYNMTEEATICQGEKYEWHGQSLTEAGRYIDTLHTINGCDSICNLVLTVNPTYEQVAEATICEGTTYSWHGKTYTTAGIYYDSLQTIHGCDSIWTLTLTVNPSYTMTAEATICEGTTYSWHGKTYTTAGIYYDSLQTIHGCDSIWTLTLTVNPAYNMTAEATICEGTTYSWHGKTYTTAGIYYDSLQTIHGCDSIWTLTLTVNPAFNMTEEATICQGEKYEWHGQSLTEAGRFTDTLHTVEGCDSICNLVLTVNPTFEQAAEAEICEGTTYSWHGKTYTTAGIYYDSLQTINGCDSIWMLTLTINRAYNVTEATTICQGEKYEWHGMSLTEAGRFTDTLHTINGCDSICNLVLTVNPTFDQTAEATICEGTTYSWHGKTYTTAGIYYDSLQTIHGCDSIWTLTLTVNPAYNMTEEATICQGETYTWHDAAYTEAGRFTDTLHTVNGCDSICNLVLTVNPTFEQTAEATICEGTTYSWHGKTYTTAGIYYDSLQTINGCDSIWTLTLTVNPAFNMTEEATICQGEKYEWHGMSLTEAGRFTDTLHTVNGCDSICNLVLTVNPTFEQVAEATICEGTTYSWHGKTYTTAGIYYDSLQTIHGCDSIWTLTLTVNPAYNMTEEATICQGEKYEWHGQSLTEAGRFTDTLHTVDGCDSICNLVLTVNPTFEQAAEATICEGTTYSWHGKTYTTAGIYYDSLQTIHGCDSIWTLTLTVNPAYNMTEEATICQGEKYEWHGQSLTEAGRYIDTLHTVNGCDSICNLVLTVNPTFDQAAEATICEGTTYSWHGKTYTTAGIYYDSLQTIHGCDSIWTLTLTVNPSYTMTEEATICQGETYTWHDAAYTEAGRYIDTLHTVNGCDSIWTLTLTVNPAYNMTEEATICEGTTYSWHGKTYMTAGIYYDSLQTVHGCDSILTLVLTVNETYSSTEDVAICQGEAFEWHGQTYTTAGRYQMTLEAKNGCDSICTLNLTVNATYTKQESAYICAGETYRWHDRDYTTAGIYQDTLQTIHGCDSICTLTLTVGSITMMPEETMTVCAKELPIVWRGQSITATGMYYDTVRNGYGCDSIYYSLQLIVNREVTITETSVICDGETITWHGRSLTKQGTYYDTLQTIHGCDSICVLNLTVNPSYYIEEIVSIREDKLPYQWQGQSITQAGTYYADYRTVNTDCDSIYTLQLMVTALPIYTVNVQADHGHVNGTGTYPEGTRITLTAVPDEGFEFQMWSDGSETNPKEFVVMQDTTFRAHFYMPEVEQEVVVDSIETHSVTITWDTVAGAVLYELRIYKNGQLVVTYEVDPDNNIIGEHHIGPDCIVARKDSTGGTSETLQVNIGGLEPGQDYTYSLDALDDDRSYVGAQSGSFTTEEEPGDGLDTLFDKQRHPGARKVLRDGRLYIELPDGTRYSPEGARLDIL